MAGLNSCCRCDCPCVDPDYYEMSFCSEECFNEEAGIDDED